MAWRYGSISSWKSVPWMDDSQRWLQNRVQQLSERFRCVTATPSKAVASHTFRITPVQPIRLDIPLCSATFPGMSKTVKDAPPVTDQAVNLPFEEALKRLEDIVDSMENHDLPLESLL